MLDTEHALRTPDLQSSHHGPHVENISDKVSSSSDQDGGELGQQQEEQHGGGQQRGRGQQAGQRGQRLRLPLQTQEEQTRVTSQDCLHGQIHGQSRVEVTLVLKL